MFFANVDSAMLAKGLSAPQHSTYFVILLDGLDLVTGPPGTAVCSVILLLRSEAFDNRGCSVPFFDSESGFYNK